MTAVARWSVRHRLTVVAAWIVVLVVAFLAQSSTGSNYAAGTSLSGTQSAEALQLLQQVAPSRSGDTERIVFRPSSGTVDSPGVRSAVQHMLSTVAQLPDVASVGSPYTPRGSTQVSGDHRVAYATVDLRTDADKVSPTAATTLVTTARAPNSATLQVDVVGSVASSTNPSSANGTLFGLIAAAVILILVFGSLLSALLPILTAGLSVVTALSVVGILSNSLSMAGFTSQLATLIGLGVGIDYSLFILSRTRTELRRGRSVERAVTTAAATSGRAVLFAGVTVCIALLGMVVMNVGVLSGAAVAASIAVLVPMLAAQTLLPALIGVLGTRTLTRRQRAALRRGDPTGPEASARWTSWARRVQRQRVGFAIAALAVLVTVGFPFLSLRQGTAGYSTDPVTTTTYRANAMLSQGFGPGYDSPLQLVAPLRTAGDQTAFAGVVAAAQHTPGVVATVGPQVLPAGAGHPAVAVAELVPATSGQDAATSALITHLRDSVVPAALHGGGPRVLVGGQTALSDDFASQLSAKLPLFVGMVVLLSFALLTVVFRSVVIPATAAVTNLLSAATAFGVIVAVFQWGWLGSLFGVSGTGPVSPLIPILMFAVLFGLSMDYEVFLISRIQEEWLRRRRNSDAVNQGQAVAGRTITAAALIMISVFVAFTFTTDRDVKMIGLGMAAAVAVDAFVVRTVLVPTVMHLAGRSNWWLPATLDRRLPHLELEAGPEEPDPVEPGAGDGTDPDHGDPAPPRDPELAPEPVA